MAEQDKKYLKVYDYYRNVIRSGSLAPGARLPSIRRRASELGYSRTTVEQAYMMLLRLVVRAPLMIAFSIVMAFVTGGPMAAVFVVVSVLLGFAVFKISLTVMPIFKRIFN